MKENLRQQWNNACLQVGIDSISAQKAAKIMAVLMVLGNNEAIKDVKLIKPVEVTETGCKIIDIRLKGGKIK